MKVVRSSPLRTGRLYPQEFSWNSFLEAESIPGHMVPSVATDKSPVVSLGTDPETLRLSAQCLNHYATLYSGDRVFFPGGNDSDAVLSESSVREK
jgi:hypothetical protein